MVVLASPSCHLSNMFGGSGSSLLARMAVAAFATCRPGTAFPTTTTTTFLHRQQAFHAASSRLAATRYILQYDYIPDVLEKRGPFREGHLKLAQDLNEEGKCLSGGPTGPVGMEVPTGAVFVFTDQESVDKFVRDDPYVSGGIVTGHQVIEWNVVIDK